MEIYTTVYKALEGVKTRAEAVRALKKTGLTFTDDTEEYGYPNLHVPTPDGGYVRVYKIGRGKGFKVQKILRVKLKWSGIPVFEPSGRHSF